MGAARGELETIGAKEAQRNRRRMSNSGARRACAKPQRVAARMREMSERVRESGGASEESPGVSSQRAERGGGSEPARLKRSDEEDGDDGRRSA